MNTIQKSTIKEFIQNNDLSNLKEYINENNIQFLPNDFVELFMVEKGKNEKDNRNFLTLEKKDIIEFTFGLIMKNLNCPSDIIDLFVHLLANDNYEIVNLLKEHETKINQKINTIKVMEELLDKNKLTKKNLLYLLSKKDLDIVMLTDFICKLIRSKNNNKLLKIIFKFFSVRNSKTINFLNAYKNCRNLSKKALLNIIESKTNKIMVTDKMYENAIIAQNYDAIKILFNNDYSDNDEMFARINYYDLLDKAIRINDKNFVEKILRYDNFKLNNITSGNIIVQTIKNNNEEIMDLLVKSSLKNCTGMNDPTPYLNLYINIAIEIRCLSFLKYIMEESAIKDKIDINVKDIYNKYPIITAIYACNLDIFKYLLDNDINTNVKNYEGRSLLSLAIDTFPGTVKYLLRTPNININEKDPNGDYPLLKAIYKNDYNLTILLYNYAHKNGIDINIKDRNGNAPLMISYKLNYQQIFRFLLMFCDVNEKDASGNTILYYAILNKHIGTVKYLINHGADVNCTDNIGNTLFDNAISTGNKEIIISLIQSKNLLLNKPNCNGETPLCSIINNNYLVIEDKEIIISELVKKGANVNFEDDKGNTPLIYAIQKNYLNISKYLIENGANVNHINKQHQSALMEAIKNDELSVVKFLIKYGAFINYNNNNNGENAFSLSLKKEKEKDNYIIFEYLINYNVNNCPHELIDNLKKLDNQKLLSMIRNNHPIYKIENNSLTNTF